MREQSHENHSLAPMFEAFELHRVEGNEAVLRPKPGNQALVQFARDALSQKAIAQQLGELAGKPTMRITVEDIESEPNPAAEHEQASPPPTDSQDIGEDEVRPPSLQDAIQEASQKPRTTPAAEEPMDFDQAMDLPWVKQFLEVFPDARIRSVTRRPREKMNESNTPDDETPDEKESA